MQYEHVLKNFDFDLWTIFQGLGVEGGMWAKCLLPCSCIEWFALIWYAICPCSKKLNFDLLTPIPRVEMGGGGPPANICYHVAAFVIVLNFVFKILILQHSDSLSLDMQHDFSEKVEFWPFDPTKGWDPGLWSKITSFYVSYWLYLCLYANFPKKYNLLSYCKILIFDLWPHQRGQGVG